MKHLLSSAVELGQRAYVGITDVDCNIQEHEKATECCAEETERYFLVVYNIPDPYPSYGSNSHFEILRGYLGGKLYPFPAVTNCVRLAN